jgi:uncharacterized protein YndB with AHSA1/START domain
MARSTDANNAAALRQPPPLKISRTFHARRETVFKAWSTADHVKNWFSPETYSVPDARVDMRLGGAFGRRFDLRTFALHPAAAVSDRGIFLQRPHSFRL